VNEKTHDMMSELSVLSSQTIIYEHHSSGSMYWGSYELQTSNEPMRFYWWFLRDSPCEKHVSNECSSLRWRLHHLCGLWNQMELAVVFLVMGDYDTGNKALLVQKIVEKHSIQ